MSIVMISWQGLIHLCPLLRYAISTVMDWLKKNSFWTTAKKHLKTCLVSLRRGWMKSFQNWMATLTVESQWMKEGWLMKELNSSTEVVQKNKPVLMIVLKYVVHCQNYSLIRYIVTNVMANARSHCPHFAWILL